jgi:hypothetical protein
MRGTVGCRALSPEDAAEVLRTAVARRALSAAEQQRIIKLLTAVQPPTRVILTQAAVPRHGRGYGATRARNGSLGLPRRA